MVAGAEAPQFGRSVGLALVYLLAAAAQTALVPNTDVGVLGMLVGNTSLILLALHGLYRLARTSTFVAFAVQLGLVVVGFGVLELIDSLLGSVAAA